MKKESSHSKTDVYILKQNNNWTPIQICFYILLEQK